MLCGLLKRARSPLHVKKVCMTTIQNNAGANSDHGISPNLLRVYPYEFTNYEFTMRIFVGDIAYSSIPVSFEIYFLPS